MIQAQPVEVEAQQQLKSQQLSQKSQLKSSHINWLMLQCQFWLFHLFITCLTLYIISQLAYIDQQATSIYDTNSYKYAKEAIVLWEKGYVIDIREVDTDNCPQGFEELIQYPWPGTYDGCYCQAIVNNHASEYILQGACSSQLISYGCTTIDALNKTNMKMWKGSKLLCYKRIKSLNFYNSTLTTTTSGTTLKTCASNASYQVSTLPNISCPSTTISNTSLSSSTQTTLTLSSTLNQKLFYESQLYYPIAQFKITEYQFCPFLDDNNISPNKNGNYILELTNFSSSCVGTDPRVVQFDYMTQEDFYTNNTRVYDLISSLPGYPRPSISYYYKLGYIRYPAWTYTCRISNTHNLTHATSHLQFTQITSTTKLLLYIGVPCLLIICTLIRLLYIIRHIFELKSKKQYNMVILTDHQIGQQIPNLNIIKSVPKQYFFFAVQIVLIVAVLGVACAGVWVLVGESRWIKDMFILGCTQDHLNGIFRLYEDRVDWCSAVLGRVIMFVVVIIVVEVLHLVLRRRVGDLKPKYQQQVPEQLSNQNLIKEQLDEKHNSININLQDSSDIILNKQKDELKIYDLDNAMGLQNGVNAGQTGLNFYAQQSIEQDNFNIGKKKKKKGIRRRNLFKEGQEK